METSLEEWKVFRGSQYLISDLGRVMNSNTQFILNPCPNKDGYKLVRIAGVLPRPKVLTISVHIMVAEAFVPNPDKLPTVNHLNGYKQDNFKENLEWASHKRQVEHAREIGLLDDANRPYPEWLCKLSDDTVREIRANSLAGVSDRKQAVIYNVHSRTIYSIRLGITYAHVE